LEQCVDMVGLAIGSERVPDSRLRAMILMGERQDEGERYRWGEEYK